MKQLTLLISRKDSEIDEVVKHVTKIKEDFGVTCSDWIQFPLVETANGKEIGVSIHKVVFEGEWFKIAALERFLSKDDAISNDEELKNIIIKQMGL